MNPEDQLWLDAKNAAFHEVLRLLREQGPFTDDVLLASLASGIAVGNVRKIVTEGLAAFH